MTMNVHTFEHEIPDLQVQTMVDGPGVVCVRVLLGPDAGTVEQSLITLETQRHRAMVWYDEQSVALVHSTRPCRAVFGQSPVTDDDAFVEVWVVDEDLCC